jgi:pilus assembly protein CpaC
VDREHVIAVAAPTPRSLRVTGIGAGEAAVAVFGRDGALMSETVLSVTDAVGGDPRAMTGPRIVAGEQVVAVDVQFAAVSASTLKALGFNFSKLSGDIQGAVISPSSLNSASFGSGASSIDASVPIQNAFNLFLSAPNRGINAVLSALSSNGLSELLAQPTLLVRSGEQASFLAGGEIPVPVPQASGTGNAISIQYKEFGVRLSVTPYVLSPDQIVLKIAPEVSELDYGSGVQLQGYVVPGLRRRSAETTVELGSGQSFVIAGLSYSSQSTTRDKTPILGDIPVIGAFFRRQQTQKERQELVIVATPRLVGPVQPKDLPALPGSLLDTRNPVVPFGVARP